MKQLISIIHPANFPANVSAEGEKNLYARLSLFLLLRQTPRAVTM